MPSVECKKCSSTNIVPKGATSFTCNICGEKQEIVPEVDNSQQYLESTFLGKTPGRSGVNTVRAYKASDSKRSSDSKPAKIDDVPPEDVIYYSAIARMDRDSINNYIKARDALQTIPDWKDSAKLIAICQKNIDDYYNQQDLENAEKKRRIKKRLTVILLCVLVLAIVVAGVLWFLFVYRPNVQYNKAVALENSGDIVGAYESYIDLKDYKDSATRAGNIYEEYKIKKLKCADVGDSIYFGSYEQDNNEGNGKENLKWKVLKKDGSSLLVITEYGVDCEPFNKTGEPVTWESSSIRKYLNSTFLNSAFDSSQRSQILSSNVTAEKNVSYDIYPGKDTRDKVFLLSISEAEKLMSDEERQCVPTAYCISKDCNVQKKKFSSEYTACWFLRTPGIERTKVAYVQYDGLVRGIGANTTSKSAAIRPAMWIEKTAH